MDNEIKKPGNLCPSKQRHFLHVHLKYTLKIQELLNRTGYKIWKTELKILLKWFSSKCEEEEKQTKIGQLKLSSLNSRKIKEKMNSLKNLWGTIKYPNIKIWVLYKEKFQKKQWYQLSHVLLNTVIVN